MGIDNNYLDPEAEVQKEYIINPLFEDLFTDHLDQPKYIQCYGGRGSGKSTATAVAMVDLTYSEYEHKIFYIRQTMTSIEDSSIADIRKAIKDLGVESDFRESKGKIYNKITGSTISFKGIRSSGSATGQLKSLSGVTTVVFEEAEEVESFEAFSKIDEGVRVKGKPLKIIMIYNPGSALSSWIHAEWFTDGQPKESRRDDTVFIHSTYLDNLENLNPKSIKGYERLKETNPIYYRNTILAEWTLETTDRIYAGWGLIPRLNEVGDVWYGLDFGYGGKDSTAVTKINWIDEVYYVEEMFSIPKLSIKETITKMRKVGIPFNAKIFADSAMPLLINEIRDGGFKGIRKCKKGKVEEAVKKVQDKNITIVGDKTSGLYYHHMTWNRTKGALKDHEPDILASLRYGILSKKPSKNPTKNKKLSLRRKASHASYSGTALH